MLSLLLAAAAFGSSDVIVERVPNSDPMRITVRCGAVNARSLIQRIGDEAGLDASAVPETATALVGPIQLREALPEDVIEVVAGAAGFIGRIERGKIRCEAVPTPKEENARVAIRREAIVQFGRFLASAADDPRSARAWLELAALHEEEADLDRAIEVLRVMREGTPEGAERVTAAAQLGRLYLLSGKPENAIEALSEIAEKNSGIPEAAEAYCLLGRCRLALNDPTVALRYFSLCRQRFPASEAALSARIWNVEALRRTGSAEDAWAEIGALEGMPLTSALALDLLEVRTLAAEGSAEHAEAAEGWLALAAATNDHRVRDQRIARADRAARLCNDPVAVLLVDMAARPNEIADVAANWLVDMGAPEAALRYKSDNPVTQFRAVLELLERGESDEAMHFLEKAPKNEQWGAVRKLLEAELALKDYKSLLVPGLLCDEIRKSSNERFVQEAMRRLGEAYLQCGDLDRAELVFRGIVPKENKE